MKDYLFHSLIKRKILSIYPSNFNILWFYGTYEMVETFLQMKNIL